MPRGIYERPKPSPLAARIHLRAGGNAPLCGVSSTCLVGDVHKEQVTCERCRALLRERDQYHLPDGEAVRAALAHCTGASPGGVMPQKATDVIALAERLLGKPRSLRLTSVFRGTRLLDFALSQASIEAHGDRVLVFVAGHVAAVSNGRPVLFGNHLDDEVVLVAAF